MDEALSLPSEKSATIALRTQQILAHETGIADVVDPLGGSHLLESLTANLQEQAERIIRRIDEMGGMVLAIEQGYPQRQIHEAAYKTQIAIEQSEQIVVGMNAFTGEENPPGNLFD